MENMNSSPKAELVAVYGRRRIGKTFLIDKTFNAKYDFYTTVSRVNSLIPSHFYGNAFVERVWRG